MNEAETVCAQNVLQRLQDLLPGADCKIGIPEAETLDKPCYSICRISVHLPHLSGVKEQSTSAQAQKLNRLFNGLGATGKTEVWIDADEQRRHIARLDLLADDLDGLLDWSNTMDGHPEIRKEISETWRQTVLDSASHINDRFGKPLSLGAWIERAAHQIKRDGEKNPGLAHTLNEALDTLAERYPFLQAIIRDARGPVEKEQHARPGRTFTRYIEMRPHAYIRPAPGGAGRA